MLWTGKKCRLSAYGVTIWEGATSGQRAIALFLTGVLTFESAFGTGPATALAEPLADGTGAQDLVQLDEADEPTSVRIATAEVQDEGPSLKVTLVEPENIADQTDQIADQTESTTTDEQLITTVSSRIELPVSLKTSLLSEDEGKLAWTLQTDGANQNSKQETTLILPSLSTLIDELGLNTSTDKNDDAENAEEGTEDTPQANGTYTPQGDPAQKTFTITWADNNDSGQTRPTTDDVKSGLVVTFAIDNEKIVLNEETAQKYFGIAEEEFVDMVSVTQDGVGTYGVELSNLYGEVVDENGEVKQVTEPDRGDAGADGL